VLLVESFKMSPSLTPYHRYQGSYGPKTPIGCGFPPPRGAPLGGLTVDGHEPKALCQPVILMPRSRL